MDDTAGAAGPEDAAASAASARSLAAGELPLEARRRLAQETGGRRLWATDLSVDELLLVEAEGYEPLGLVLGSSVYHVGWQRTGFWGPNTQELTTVTEAHLHARALAMGRMEREAAALGAHGVVGVRLTTKGYEGSSDLLEFTAIGTAVRVRGAPPPARPFLSDLSGEDFWTLRQAGYTPVGLAMGFCAYLVYPGKYPYTTGNLYSYGNLEMSEFTRGIYEARRLALARLRAELPALGASGVAGMKIEIKKHMHEREVNNTHYLLLQIDFFALGTAIAPGHPPAQTAARPRAVLNMSGLRPVRSRLAGAELSNR